jgi:hypothetical protein
LAPEIEPAKGWQWWCLTHECVEYVLRYTEANPEFVRFFRSTHIPDESFIHTIIANSDFLHTLSPGRATGPIAGNHFIQWDRGNGRGKPCILNENDFDALVASDACFARKVSETDSAPLIGRLRERVGGRM